MAGDVTYTPCEADYVAANRRWYLRSLRGRRAWKIRLSTLGVTAAGGAALGAIDNGLDPVAILSFAVLCPFFALLLLPLLYGFCYLAIPGRAWRLFRHHKAMHRPVRYTWSDHGLTYDSSTGAGSVAWSDLHRWLNGRDTFLFFITDVMFHFIPKRVLSAVEAEDLAATAAASALERY